MTDPRDADVTHALDPAPPRPTVTGEVLDARPDVDLPEGARPDDARPEGTRPDDARPDDARPGGGPGPYQVVARRLAALPLQARLVGILLAALLVALAATGYGVQSVLRGYLVTKVDDQLHAVYLQGLRDQGSLQGIIDIRSSGRPRFPTNFASYSSVDGHPELSGAGGGRPDHLAPRFDPVSFAEAAGLHGRIITLGGGGTTWHAVAVPVQFRSDADPTETFPGSVILALPLNDVERAVTQVRLLTLIIGALVILGCSLLGWLAIRRSFRPLVEVEETAAAIAAGDLSRRVPERPSSTEVGRLTRSLNGMLTQIESAFRAQEASEARTRRFAADASHELRTPLVSIRGFAELYRQGAVPPEEVPRTLRRIEDEATRMGSLVEDLLLLARLDAQRPGRHDPVDLAVLAGDAVHDARGLDPARTVSLAGLDGHGPRPAVVTGDEDRLRQVVANLVANAVRHTPAGTPVEIAVGRRDDRGVLEVRDHGRGLTPEQARRVFERFYRVDSSRARGSGGGSGLGLSIVAAVVAAHAGTVEVDATPGGGATFRVSLPGRPDGAGAPSRDAGPPVAAPQPPPAPPGPPSPGMPWSERPGGFAAPR